MATIRQQNFIAQQRLDVPHLRSIESAVARDFDILAGSVVAGNKALVVKGFSLVTAGAIGSPATALQMVVADGVLLHPLASESGTLYVVPSSTPNEVLSSANPVLIGGFSPSRVNYIGIDLRRLASASTSDLVAFLDPDSLQETSRVVPLARTLQHRIVISTTDFDSQTTVLPIAKVTVNGAGIVTDIEDARNMAYRLGRGGSVPDANAPYSFPGGRDESIQEAAGDLFNGGDKAIDSLKSWMDAVMTRIWELGGGARWYGATVDRNILLVWDGAPFPTGENFYWDGTNLTWTGLKFLFDNSPGWFNDIKNQTVSQAGLTNLSVGEALYVDIDRDSNRTGATALVPAKASLISLGSGNPPGSRQIIAWRTANGVFTRNWRYALGTAGSPATTATIGMLAASRTPTNPNFPVALVTEEKGAANGVVPLNADSHAQASNYRGTAAILNLGTDTATTLINVGNGPSLVDVDADLEVRGAFTLDNVQNTNIWTGKFDSVQPNALDSGVGQMVNGVFYGLMKGYQRGNVSDGEAIVFPIPYTGAIPTVKVSGGILVNNGSLGWDNGIPTGGYSLYQDHRALNVTSTGFTGYGKLVARSGTSSTNLTVSGAGVDTVTTRGGPSPSLPTYSTSTTFASGASTSGLYNIAFTGKLTAYAYSNYRDTSGTLPFPIIPANSASTSAVLKLQINNGGGWLDVAGTSWTTPTVSCTGTTYSSGSIPNDTPVQSWNNVNLDKNWTNLSLVGVNALTQIRVALTALNFSEGGDGANIGNPSARIGFRIGNTTYTKTIGGTNTKCPLSNSDYDVTMTWEAWLD